MSPEEMQAALADMQDQLTQLTDRQEILDAIVAYARSQDRLDKETFYRAYHQDALDDHGPFVGDSEAFWDWASGVLDTNYVNTQHFVTNHSLDIDGASAHAETYWMLAGIQRSGTPFTLAGGRYLDRLEKRDGSWRIHARVLIVEWAMPPVNTREAMEAAATSRDHFSPRDRAMFAARPQGRRDRDDPSYARPLEVDPSRIAAYRDFATETPDAATGRGS